MYSSSAMLRMLSSEALIKPPFGLEILASQDEGVNAPFGHVLIADGQGGFVAAPMLALVLHGFEKMEVDVNGDRILLPENLIPDTEALTSELYAKAVDETGTITQIKTAINESRFLEMQETSNALNDLKAVLMSTFDQLDEQTKQLAIDLAAHAQQQLLANGASQEAINYVQSLIDQFNAGVNQSLAAITGTVAAIKSNTDSIKSTVAAINSNAAAANSNAAAAKSNTDSIKSTVAAINSNAAAANSNAAAAKSNTDSIKSTVAAINSNAAAAKSNTDSIKSIVAAINSNAAAAKSNTDSIKGTIGTINETVSAVGGNVAGVLINLTQSKYLNFFTVTGSKSAEQGTFVQNVLTEDSTSPYFVTASALTLTFDFKLPTVVSFTTLVLGRFGAVNAYSPQKYELEGSQNNSNWTKLNLSADVGKLVLGYQVLNPGEYRYYRWKFTGAGYNGYMAISIVRMWSSSVRLIQKDDEIIGFV